MNLDRFLVIAFVTLQMVAGPPAKAASAPQDGPGQPSMPSRWVVDPATGETVELVEGDMGVPTSLAKGNYTTANPMWERSVLPYVFDASVDASQRTWILEAMAMISSAAAVRFVGRSNEPDYVIFRTGGSGSGCYSTAVGRRGGAQTINLQSSANGTCYPRGIVMHEILHALGFWHEHMRPDRDGFVTIVAGNIAPGQSSQFAIRSEAFPATPYDYLSIMHYGRTAFSIGGGAPTILAPAPWTYMIGNRSNLSEGDVATLRWLYGRAGIYFGSGGQVASDVVIGDRFFETGDINGDERDDLVKWELPSGNAGVLFAASNCTAAQCFDPNRSASAFLGSGGDSTQKTLRIGDVTGDGADDLVAVDFATGIRVARWTGSALLSSMQSYPLGGTTTHRHVLLGNIDSDTALEILIWDLSTGLVHAGNYSVANSRFDFVTTYWDAGGTTQTKFVGAGDFNGDAREDLAQWNVYTGNFAYIVSTGDGRFDPGAAAYLGSGGSRADRFFAVADVNGDHFAEPVSWELPVGNVNVRLNNHNGTFAPLIATYFGNGGSSSDRVFFACDLTGDGADDVFKWEVANPGNAFQVLRSTGDGRFAFHEGADLGRANSVSQGALRWGDINGDGRCDPITYFATTGMVNFRFVGTQAAASPTSMAIGDWSSDGVFMDDLEEPAQAPETDAP